MAATSPELAYQHSTGSQERLFSVEEIDQQIAQEEIQTIEIAQELLEADRQEAVSYYDDASAIRRFLSCRFGTIALINELHDERMDNLSHLKQFAELLLEGKISVKFYLGLKEESGDSKLIKKAEDVRKEREE